MCSLAFAQLLETYWCLQLSKMHKIAHFWSTTLPHQPLELSMLRLSRRMVMATMLLLGASRWGSRIEDTEVLPNDSHENVTDPSYLPYPSISHHAFQRRLCCFEVVILRWCSLSMTIIMIVFERCSKTFTHLICSCFLSAVFLDLWGLTETCLSPPAEWEKTEVGATDRLSLLP